MVSSAESAGVHFSPGCSKLKKINITTYFPPRWISLQRLSIWGHGQHGFPYNNHVIILLWKKQKMCSILLHFHKLCSNPFTNRNHKGIKICSRNGAFLLEEGKLWGLKSGPWCWCRREILQGRDKSCDLYLIFYKLQHPTLILPFIFSQVIPFICIFFYLPLP